jgi:hypothetical protein
MRKRLFLLLPVGLVIILTVALSAQDIETKGKAWVDAHSESPAPDVSGVWYAREWGKIVVNQSRHSRDLAGKGDGWEFTGVGGGKQVFFLFSSRGKIMYSAELTSEGENRLNGSYAKGFMDDRSNRSFPRSIMISAPIGNSTSAWAWE